MPDVLSAGDSNVIEIAMQVLAAGKLVVLPTDTVYGIAARLADDAIMRLYLAKERPPDKAIPILLASIEDVELVAQPLTLQVRQIAKAFWPGPLTLVLPKRDGLPQRVSSVPTVGVRVPNNETAQAVIKAAGGALAVSSANLSGQSASHTVQEAIDQLGDAVSLAIDGGPCQGETASTVAAIDGRSIRVIREGPISEAQLQAVFGSKDQSNG